MKTKRIKMMLEWAKLLGALLLMLLFMVMLFVEPILKISVYIKLLFR